MTATDCLPTPDLRGFRAPLTKAVEGSDGSISSSRSSYFGWDGDRLIHTEHTDALKPEQRQITHTVYEPGSFTPLVQLSTSGKQQAKQHALVQALAVGLQDEDEDNAQTLAMVQAMLGAMPQQLQDSANHSMQHALQHGLPASAMAMLGDQGQNTLQRLIGLREQLEKQEQSQRTEITVRHYHCDHLGTPLALTDESNQIVWAARLDPWGNVEQEYNPESIDQSIRLPGQHQDKDTGLYYNRHRYYDPNIGSYINQDPIGLAGGSNHQIYPNNPLRWADPLGLIKIHGNWCGPDHTGGFNKPYDQLDAAERKAVLPPISQVDACCKTHDMGYAECRANFPCNAEARQKCFEDLDRQLSQCAEKANDNYSTNGLLVGNPKSRIIDYMKDSKPGAGQNAQTCTKN